MISIKHIALVLCVLTAVCDARKNVKDIFKTQAKRAACAANETPCKNGECVQIDWICDTENDCYDDSDEIGCPMDCSGEHQLKCNNGLCISREFQCDGENDCRDMTDEKGCENVQCGVGEVKCSNFLCIEAEWLCDGDNDCGNGWDEQNCSSTSGKRSAKKFMKKLGKESLSRRQVSTCGANQHQCQNGACIQEEWVCDTQEDCTDKSDEVNCATDCSGEHQFKCTNNRCIAKEFQCDGDNDCGDMSDEIDCRKSCISHYSILYSIIFRFDPFIFDTFFSLNLITFISN
uniref:Uncharacterized protein n=1 Tax=Biomphalaria glabrata TaxID=6526 RepID=A0A2C9K4U4_BIOGL